MSMPAKFGPKEFCLAVSFDKGYNPAKALLRAAAAGLAATQTTSGLAPWITADWEPWRLFGDARRDTCTLIDGGRRVTFEGKSLSGETRYRQHERGQVARGSVLCRAFCGKPRPRRVILYLTFRDTRSSVMWYSLTPELVVYHTVMAIAGEIRATVFGGRHADPVLRMLGPWTNVVLDPLGTEF